MLSGNDTYALDLSFLYIIKTTPLAIAYLFHRTVCHSLVCVSLINDLHSTETPIQISMAINAVLSYCSFPAVHFRLVLSHYLTPSPIPGISVSSFLTAAFGITTYSISNMPTLQPWQMGITLKNDLTRIHEHASSIDRKAPGCLSFTSHIRSHRTISY